MVSEIVGDAYYERSIKINVLASALWAVCKDTKWHEDAKDIINGCYPDYFEEEKDF